MRSPVLLLLLTLLFSQGKDSFVTSQCFGSNVKGTFTTPIYANSIVAIPVHVSYATQLIGYQIYTDHPLHQNYEGNFTFCFFKAVPQQAPDGQALGIANTTFLPYTPHLPGDTSSLQTIVYEGPPVPISPGQLWVAIYSSIQIPVYITVLAWASNSCGPAVANCSFAPIPSSVTAGLNLLLCADDQSGKSPVVVLIGLYGALVFCWLLLCLWVSYTLWSQPQCSWVFTAYFSALCTLLTLIIARLVSFVLALTSANYVIRTDLEIAPAWLFLCFASFVIYLAEHNRRFAAADVPLLREREKPTWSFFKLASYCVVALFCLVFLFATGDSSKSGWVLAVNIVFTVLLIILIGHTLWLISQLRQLEGISRIDLWVVPVTVLVGLVARIILLWVFYATEGHSSANVTDARSSNNLVLVYYVLGELIVVIAWNLLIARIVLVFKGYLSANDPRQQAHSLPLKDETAELSADILAGVRIGQR